MWVSHIPYAEAPTPTPHAQDVLKGCLETMRSCGIDDGRILEINQVVSYFNYANGTVIGLGITIDGDILGLLPGNSENPDDWSHG